MHGHDPFVDNFTGEGGRGLERGTLIQVADLTHQICDALLRFCVLHGGASAEMIAGAPARCVRGHLRSQRYAPYHRG